MDGLSAAASVIAVPALALQLVESTQKILNFWDSIQHAPEEIDEIKLDLEYLRNVLEQIGNEAQHQPSSALAVSTLNLCSKKINAVRSLTVRFESKLKCSGISTRKWSALRVVLRREKIEKVQNSLSSIKATLALAVLNNVG